MAVSLTNRSVVGNMRSLTYSCLASDTLSVPVTFPCSITAVDTTTKVAVQTLLSGGDLTFTADAGSDVLRVNIIGVGGG